jgi:hypothetical protein
MFKSLCRKFYWDDLDALYFGGYALWNYLNLLKNLLKKTALLS